MFYRIEMKVDGQWVMLGGMYDGNTASERISQFQLNNMVRSIPKRPDSALICNREFRMRQVDQELSR